MALPSGYKKLKYIESYGQEYIETEVTATSSPAKLQIKLALTSAAANQYIMGSYHFNLYCNGSIITADYVSSLTFIQGDNVANTEIKELIYSSTAAYGRRTPLLANRHSTTIGNKTKARVYYAKMYDGNNLIRDFVPAMRKSDGAVGLYDLLNDVFYPNANGGAFGYEIGSNVYYGDKTIESAYLGGQEIELSPIHYGGN